MPGIFTNFYSSITADFLTSLILIYGSILIFFNFKRIMRLHYYAKISILLTFVIACGSHALMHLAEIPKVPTEVPLHARILDSQINKATMNMNM